MRICINYMDRLEWVELPADIEDIAEAFDIDLEEESEFEDYYEIVDIETDLDFRGHMLAAFDLDELSALAECEDEFHDEAVAISEALSLTDVDWTTCKNVTLARVNTWEEFGEYLVENDYFGPVPANLTDYLDYEAIGRSYEYDGTFTSTGFLFDW